MKCDIRMDTNQYHPDSWQCKKCGATWIGVFPKPDCIQIRQGRMSAGAQDCLLKLTEQWGALEVLRVLAVIANGIKPARLFKKLDKVYTEMTTQKDAK